MTKTKQSLLLSTALICATFFLAQWFQNEWVFHRDKIASGQWWRIVSGNYTHSNISHLAINLFSLLLLVFLFFDTLKSKTFIFSTIILSFIVGFGLFQLNPELHRYFGFSGVLYGLFIVAASHAILKKDFVIAPLVLFFVLGKIVWEFFHGGSQTSADLIGIPVATEAHRYGVIGAVIISSGLFIQHFYLLKTQKRHPPTFE